MSVHLKWGEVHPRTLLADLAPLRSAGAAAYRRELAWREFFADVLAARPDTARDYLRPEFAAMRYDRPGDAFDAWREGRTGFPVVDAGMRQLRATGWMHNRVRMVVASFLVKDLHLEWRHGARHFMRWLVDGDLASNQQNWQWVAGSGTDAAPYFRVFNPTSQGRRFDPDGGYVRRWVPELAEVGDPHDPSPDDRRAVGLPRPDRRPRVRAPRGPRPMGGDPMTDPLLVPRRFCGPPSSGNGGWTAGALAALGEAGAPGPAIAVSLRRPPPLDTPMPVSIRDGATEARHGQDVVALAEAADGDLVVVDPVPAEEARAAEASYAGHAFHPFPTCFVCGTGRGPGDGLRIFPGRVADDRDGAARVAATWTPDESVADRDGRTSLAMAWAALDCVGGWAGDLEERLMVLARMTARVDALPVVGEEHVVVGLHRGTEGRKTWTAATLYDGDGRVVGRAEHTWIAVNPAAFA